MNTTTKKAVNIVNGKSISIVKNRRISVPDRKIKIDNSTESNKKKSNDRRVTEMNSKEKKVLIGGNGLQIKIKNEEENKSKSNNFDICDPNKSIEITNLLKKKSKINYFSAYKKKLQIIETITR